MKIKKHLLVFAISLMASISFASAQDYGKVEHWGKTYNLDRSFFEYLNQNMDVFINGTARQWKHYDYGDYKEIYVAIVNYLRNKDNMIFVSEANQLQFRSSSDIMPGQLSEKRNKKSMTRAVWVQYNVVLPSLQQFVKNYDSTHQFQQ